MLIAGEWYESETFWTAAGVVVAVLVGVATLTVTYRVAYPRRRLVYALKVTPLLNTSSRYGLEISYRDKVIREPHLAELVIEGKGRRDITSATFDNNAPLTFHLTAQIVHVLHTIGNTSNLPVELDDQERALKIGPGRIGRRQRLVTTVLVDGKPYLMCRDNPLIDVKVTDHNNRLFTPKFIAFLALMPVVYVAIALLVVVIANTVLN